MSLTRAIYECVCFKVGPLGGIEVELYRVLVIHGRLLLTIFERIISENELFLKFCIPLPMTITHTLLCKIAHLSEMTILKIVSGSLL